MLLTWQEFIAGWIGGIGGLILSHPIDTLKVRHQRGKSSIRSALIKTFRYEGIHGFYKGMGFPLVMSGVQNSVYFGVYANTLRFLLIRDQYEQTLHDIPWLLPVFIAGCYGGIGQVIVNTPVEIIKIKLQTRTGVKKLGSYVETPHASTLECIRSTYRLKGLRGFYHGLLPTVCRDVPTAGIYISTYVWSDLWLSSRNVSEFWCHFISGGLAGVVSYAPVTPFDVVKTRLQADNPDCPRYNGIFDCIKQSYKQHGFKVFWRGLTLNCFRSFIANAGIFVCYEICLKVLYSPTSFA